MLEFDGDVNSAYVAISALASRCLPPRIFPIFFIALNSTSRAGQFYLIFLHVYINRSSDESFALQ